MPGRPAPKRGGRTQVAASRYFQPPLNDPTISHGSIDTKIAGLFNVFLWVMAIVLLGGAGASRPAVISGSIGLNPETPLHWINNSYGLDPTV
jgi:hypothetical protein